MSALHAPPPPAVVVGDDGLARPAWAARDPLLRAYYDTEWGVPIRDEPGLYERLVLEGFQAGLSWATILRKRDAFRKAFAGFDPEQVATFGEAEVHRLLQDAGIVRHEGKIRAAIQNARATLELRPSGGLSALIWSHLPERTPVPRRPEDLPAQTPESAALSRALRQHGFRFVGPTTAYALMSAIGMADLHLVGSHRRGCSGLWHPDGTRR
ncbi:MAG TPA: DNA-3-methyladenine glycosylase I [Myxococcaceae bacterium]|nr:DNA-3-methyladenine glycosylase I [Myxococcaceae bacterium]